VGRGIQQGLMLMLAVEFDEALRQVSQGAGCRQRAA
jgi:hypothetical protein